ncbi:NUDIX domain-containing protein [Saccharopolyspora griseoalba]|uniref:8-oxo-dGTP diphosphatase n=1 Tax=Saccharopolyspora griseoalba TaxID=1431848 RepID=A0ABW2LNH3_9PSEU
MSVLRSTGLIEAPAATVGAAVRHTRTAEAGLAPIGVIGRARTSPAALLVPGDELSFSLRAAGLPLELTTRVERAAADGISSVLVDGPLARLRHDTALAQVGPRTLLTDSVSWTSPLGPLGKLADVVLGRRLVLDVLAARVRAVRELAESWAGRSIVVGTAIIRGGEVLAQQRGYPAADAGRWELPGGRVEPGESEADAVVRECREELGIDVEPTGRLGTDVPLDNGMLMRVHTARPVDADPDPRPIDHQALRWVGAAELGELDWLDTDRVLLHDIRGRLS